MTHRLPHLVAAAMLAVAATVLPGATLAPAYAAACTDAGGITVVSDPGALPGSLSQSCVSSAGDDAAALFSQAGHSLTRVNRFPGAVCKVDGEPASSSCTNMPPTNAYWGLFWSNGTSGSWVYSSAGVDNLNIPAGGSVAFAWQSSSSRRNPAVPPPDHGGSTGEDPGDSGGTGDGTGGGSGGGRGGGSTGDGSPTGSPSSSPSTTQPPPGDAAVAERERTEKRDRDSDDRARERPRDRETESPAPTDDATLQPDAVGDNQPAAASEPVADGGLPLWLVGLAAGCLLAVAGVVAVVRRDAARNA